MRTAVGLVANAAHVLAVQVLALVSLTPGEYGAFSLQYLLYALGASLALSVVSEAWLRHELATSTQTGWREYGNASLLLAAVMGVVVAIVSTLVPMLLPVAVVGSVAVFSSLYRTAARYYAVRRRRPVLLGDLSGFAVTVGVWGWFAMRGDHSLFGMTFAWAAGSIAASLASRLPPKPSLSRARAWSAERRDHIHVLLRDSLLMDAGAIGTPYLLAPLLGVVQFGIYRAVSNVAAPVRLIITPLRPRISMLATRPTTARIELVVLAVSLAMGGAAYLALLYVASIQPWDLGTLSELGPFALPTAVFVAANFLGTFHYVIARSGLEGSRLMLGRVVQTLLAIASPLAGFASGGLGGAIWGYALGTVASSIVWAVLASRRHGGLH